MCSHKGRAFVICLLRGIMNEHSMKKMASVEFSNTIVSLKEFPFSRRTNEEKAAIKQLGPPRPDLNIKQVSTKGEKAYTQSFNKNWYLRKTWLAGCHVANALFCYPCLLFHPEGNTADGTAWTIKGVTDMQHLSEKVKKHEKSKNHMDSCLKFSALGRVNIATQLDEGYRLAVLRHNDEVSKNRHILNRLIQCVKFCGIFELALRGKDETEGSTNPGIFRGLVDFVAELDEVFDDHLKTASVFKGTSKTIQNELGCMLRVVRERIVEEVKAAKFVAIDADETTDVSTQTQLVLVLRYIDSNNAVHERCFEFLPLTESTSTSIANVILERLNSLFSDDDREKLIAQAYDGASVMRGEKAGVQRKVREHFPNAHYVHCYAHQLNLIMQQATSHISKVKVFFSELSGISTFFSRSPKRTSILDQVVTRRLPRASATRWNFNSRIVSTVYENRADLIECFEAIKTSGSFDPLTVREASGYIRMLQDEDFVSFLSIFHSIMPHVDVLYQQLQQKDIDAVLIQRALQKFTSSVQAIR
ncbi:hypothetical protein ACEWY4_020534 [Coilia grayii]|uniref:TTF-type domain-containing protein n=1 Tax=Coilia grayii TaxID=363190 RepID=A0ABD1JCW7_9TELE